MLIFEGRHPDTREFLRRRWARLSVPLRGHSGTLAVLSDAGRALLPALEQITRWAEEYLPS